MDNQNPMGTGGGYAGGGGGGQPMPAGTLDVQDVLSTTFRTIGAALVPIVGGALIVAVPSFTVSLIFQALMYLVVFSGGQPSLEQLQMAGLIGVAMYPVLILVMLAAHAVGQGGIMYAVAERLSGRSPTLGQSLRVALQRSPQAILTSFLVGIPAIIGLLMCIAPGVIVMIFGAVALPVCIVERLGPIDSIQRSVALTEGNRLMIFLIGLVVFIGAMVAGCCLIGPVIGIITASAASHAGDIAAAQEMQNPLSWQQLLIHLAQFPMLIVQTMVFATTTAVIYARLRGLRDGVDAQAIASVFT